MSFSKESKSIIASNLTTALAILVASGKSQEDGISIIEQWYHHFYSQGFLNPESTGEPLIPEA